MSEEELAKLVTVDSLIGAGYALEPSQQREAEKSRSDAGSAQSPAGLRRMMESTNSKYKIGDAVMVAVENPTGNPRTPRYISGKRGVIGSVHGILENIRDHRGIHKPLYTVKFDLSEVSTCHDQDSIWVDVHEEWLSEVRQDS